MVVRSYPVAGQYGCAGRVILLPLPEALSHAVLAS